MDEQPSPTEFTSESTSREEDSAHDRYTGAFFPKGRNFVVAGGSFTSITSITRSEPNVPPDFRMLSLGDLDLCREIRLESSSGKDHRRRRVVSARRVYSARVHGCSSNMTVVVYQGENTEEDWRHDITRHSYFRHPNIVQLFGTVKSRGLHAAIYFDDLIPAQQVVQESFSKTPMFPTYIWACMELEFADACKYLQAFSGNDLLPDWEAYIPWIRRTTGRLSIELTTNLDPLPFEPKVRKSRTTISLLDTPLNSEIVASLSLSGYHEICREWQAQVGLTLGRKNVRLGAVYHRVQPDIGDCTDIASCDVDDLKCNGWQTNRQCMGFKMESGWTRIHSSDVGNIKFWSTFSSSQASQNWLTQANSIFERLKIESSLEDYVLIDTVNYFLDKDPNFEREATPSGYLFLGPVADLQSEKPGPLNSLECTAYWSLDPLGVSRMNTEEAEAAGFPRLRWNVGTEVCIWEDSVYVGLRTFHAGKGFNPDSQDLARHLGCPLYEVSSGIDIPFAYVEQPDAVDKNEEIPFSEQVEMISMLLGHTGTVNKDKGSLNEDLMYSEGTHESKDTDPVNENKGTLAEDLASAKDPDESSASFK